MNGGGLWPLARALAIPRPILELAGIAPGTTPSAARASLRAMVGSEVWERAKGLGFRYAPGTLLLTRAVAGARHGAREARASTFAPRVTPGVALSAGRAGIAPELLSAALAVRRIH